MSYICGNWRPDLSFYVFFSITQVDFFNRLRIILHVIMYVLTNLNNANENYDKAEDNDMKSLRHDRFLLMNPKTLYQAAGRAQNEICYILSYLAIDGDIF